MVLLQVAIDGSSKAFKMLLRTQHVLRHLDEVLTQVSIGGLPAIPKPEQVLSKLPWSHCLFTCGSSQTTMLQVHLHTHPETLAHSVMLA